MIATPKFFGKIKDGWVSLDNKETYTRWLRSKFKEEQRVELTVAKESQDQTHEQYKYLYSCVYPPFAEEYGWSISEVDEWMKKSFMEEYGIILPKGMMLSKAANFNRLWLSRYIDFSVQKCAEMGIAVLPPCRTWKE